MTGTPAFATRLVWAMAALLLAFGLLVGVLVHVSAGEREQESLQRLSHGLARHIVEHWPEIAQSDPRVSDQAARDALLSMLMVVNPGIEVYLLDADGRVADYIGEPGMVRIPQVELASVRDFLAGAALPLRGTDPKGVGGDKIFSAAMFPPKPGDSRPPGYLYVVLEGQAREQVALGLGGKQWGHNLLLVIGAAMVATMLAGAFAFNQLTRPLHRLARRMRDFKLGDGVPPRVSPPGDELGAIAGAFDAMALRIEQQLQAQREQAATHREVIANVAHDLRTPLTALHGHLEALAAPGAVDAGPQRQALLGAALSQSEKVRRLTRQLFELATLQSTDDLPQREQFRLDELVSDTVQKFHPGLPHPPVLLVAPSPGPIVLDGDLHLIERALSNLIDNAVRHAGGPEPVQVSLVCEGPQVEVRVSDRGPGLPPELARRLDAGQPVREPPERRPGDIGKPWPGRPDRLVIVHPQAEQLWHNAALPTADPSCRIFPASELRFGVDIGRELTGRSVRRPDAHDLDFQIAELADRLQQLGCAARDDTVCSPLADRQVAPDGAGRALWVEVRTLEPISQQTHKVFPALRAHQLAQARERGLRMPLANPLVARFGRRDRRIHRGRREL